MIAYEEVRVPVAGGELAVLRWPAREPGAPVVLALHGITANALSWGPVARLLDGRVTLVAPDLRGRAGSSSLPGPYGIAAHADDVAAVAAALGTGRVVLAGHSMGAFVAALAAVRHPERFGPLLLVDGGIGFPAPTHLAPDELMTAVIGPAMDRLSMTFPDRAAYRSFWQAHPAFADAWSDEVDAYIQRDLTGEEPALRSTCRIEAVRTDGIGLFDEEVLTAVRKLPVPATLLWAQRGLMGEEQGLYDESRLAAADLGGTRVTPVAVRGVNHYTVLTGDAGGREIARRLLDLSGV
ncbi:alpha/beta hydrolase [Streptomyces sp. NBC_00264]|uniref:alpha/beta hydrolase n=1 Tax=unclassified Streptomyces TaxID=2593676 RepID=UPI000F5BEA2A|nr:MULTISPECIES: alpha/beta hydrolase [unclassified Streptomyces]WSG50575.1 alpha/beta hydrolase [Streptomyces sp. NBC_01732]WSX01231.1 alpha/beta hydrolase [Streptomyces sp. NBC_00987]MCX5100460.1 alpha/beta hydrolase [Streptomyces sp. NBC_00439]MCX5159929.1 alpha/beta hydrolase [Streptomyces sp. NBC_00305]MCX5218452.1 alpha/beta hydrolase [Streptomyces sp. NBC_00264]